jgi:hypothetical protein
LGSFFKEYFFCCQKLEMGCPPLRGLGSFFETARCTAWLSAPRKIYFWTTFDSFVIFYLCFLFVWGASPGSAGCFKKATQTPNAGHPIFISLFFGIRLKKIVYSIFRAPNFSLFK